MKNVTRLLCLAAVLGVCVPSAAAFADDSKVEKPGDVSTDDYATKNIDDGSYGVVFKDDDLLGGGIDASVTIIKVRPPGARERLIRPRTQFVAELTKSVENL